MAVFNRYLVSKYGHLKFQTEIKLAFTKGYNLVGFSKAYKGFHVNYSLVMNPLISLSPNETSKVKQYWSQLVLWGGRLWISLQRNQRCDRVRSSVPLQVLVFSPRLSDYQNEAYTLFRRGSKLWWHVSGLSLKSNFQPTNSTMVLISTMKH